MAKIKTGIIGAAGYTAGELFRILINHPEVEIVFAHSNSNAGNPVVEVHTDLVGETDIVFTDKLEFDKVDAIFLCMGHGVSKTFLEDNEVPASVKIIDLSTDFRHKAEGNDFVYGLPELNKEAIKSCIKLANPGCFATSIQLALLPLAAKGLIKSEVHVNAVTGSTGAGQKPTGTSHFSWRNNNISVYKAFGHQHLKEITESVVQLQGDFNYAINFVPVRGDFARGIMAAVYTETSLSEEELKALYADYYADHAFTHVVNKNPHLKQVVNTNKAVVFVEKHGNKVFVISMIDNLLKGASGQAVENMNLMFGLDEKTGLGLKPVAF